jgi:hypothetical protein
MLSQIVAANWSSSSVKAMDGTKGINIQERVRIIMGIKSGVDIQLLQGRFAVTAGRQRFGCQNQGDVTWTGTAEASFLRARKASAVV